MTLEDGIDLKRWRPLSVRQTAELMIGLEVEWWIAGGWAIDLFLDRTTRDHADTDVLVLRRDQVRVCLNFLNAGWDLWAVDRPDHLRPLKRDETVPSSVNDIWCRPDRRSAWALQLMLGESEGKSWIYRRDREVSLPLSEVGLHTPDAVPYVAPQIELLFKSRSPRPRDEADFTLAMTELSPPARRWLALAITRADPEHPWLKRLQ